MTLALPRTRPARSVDLQQAKVKVKVAMHVYQDYQYSIDRPLLFIDIGLYPFFITFEAVRLPKFNVILNNYIPRSICYFQPNLSDNGLLKRTFAGQVESSLVAVVG